MYTDKDRLEQVVINLLGNANKYAYPETPICIDATYDEKNATIKIINQSDYISENTLNTLFDKFIRIDDKTTRTTRGTGLGLYIVKGLIDAMEGKISLKSTQENIFIAEIVLPLYKEETTNEA